MTTNPAATFRPAPRIAATVQPGIRGAPGPQLFARVVAALAVGMGMGHVLVVAAFPHGVWMGSVLGAMVLLCLKCAHRAWNNPAALLELLAMSALMALAHTFMALGIHEHRHGGQDAVAAAGAAAMLGIAAGELVLVMLCGIGMRMALPRGAPGGERRHR